MSIPTWDTRCASAKSLLFDAWDQTVSALTRASSRRFSVEPSNARAVVQPEQPNFADQTLTFTLKSATCRIEGRARSTFGARIIVVKGWMVCDLSAEAWCVFRSNPATHSG